MTIPGQYRPSTAYITGLLQCVSNGPITFCTSFPYRPDTCSQESCPLTAVEGPRLANVCLGLVQPTDTIMVKIYTLHI